MFAYLLIVSQQIRRRILQTFCKFSSFVLNRFNDATYANKLFVI